MIFIANKEENGFEEKCSRSQRGKNSNKTNKNLPLIGKIKQALK